MQKSIKKEMNSNGNVNLMNETEHSCLFCSGLGPSLEAPVFQQNVFITLRRVVLRHHALSAEQLKPPEEEDDRGQQEHLHCDEDEEADLRGQSQITQPVTTGLQQLLLGQIHEQAPPQVSGRSAADVPETQLG